MKGTLRIAILAILTQYLLIGCVSHIYKPGSTDNKLNQIKLGQTYGDMVKALGEPDHSSTENRMTEETIILFTPLWNIIEWIGDFNPSMIQIYIYDQLGTVTVDNNNHIIRIEAK
ncbi:hypothetical protein KFZ76_07355 [Methylovulum psychrotolerans]|uniref:hypothetical protein n=1 Tax=Methylovulum psychrotolerans TaxID=1704499 RepID=UPI001BFFC4B1|nr:hypothetical protein [Methylovulum psychrotolerans]MBT9097524.1 hypothetical protein [Methylovulum psychrotolerans]